MPSASPESADAGSAGAVPPNGWDIRPGLRVWVGGNDVPVRRAVERFLVGVLRPPLGPIDAAVIAPLSADEACYFLAKLRPRLAPEAIAWVVEMMLAGSSSMRTALDARAPALGFSHETTISLEPTLLAHGYRRGL